MAHPVAPHRSGINSRRIWRAVILFIGLIAGQAILIGPSLIGKKIFLPLDLLEPPPVYLPDRLWQPEQYNGDMIRLDPVWQLEPDRVYAVRQVRSGHLPLWNPYNYCGAPFLAANQPAVLSPFRLLDYLWPGPMALAWGQVLRALVAGGGAYLFFRRAMRLRFLAALIPAWCYPVGGFLTIWAGYLQASEVTWFPLLLLATHATIRSRRRRRAISGLALVTAAVLLSGHSATGLQMLIASGLFAFWTIHYRFGIQALAHKPGWNAIGALLAGWIIGIGLSMPQTLPTLQYMRDSWRISARQSGAIETPPDGLHALPQLVLPYFFGSSGAKQWYLLKSTLVEGLATGYAGLVLTIVVAPFAWLSRRHRCQLIFWGIAAIVGMGYVLDLPGLAAIYRAPLINTLRNNRLTFVTGFAILCWAAVGLNVLLSNRRIRARWMLAGIVAAILGLMCVYRIDEFPPPLHNAVTFVQQNEQAGHFNPVVHSDQLVTWFINLNLWGAAWCGLAIICLVVAVLIPLRKPRVWMIGIICVTELLVTAQRIDWQGDPSLYYPRLGVFDELAAKPPGRVCAARCLPAQINLIPGIAYLGGYDAADPREIVQLLQRIIDPQSMRYPYAQVQWFWPEKDSPVLDLLALRYIVGYGTAPPGANAEWSDGDYFIIERPWAATRVFVPKRIETIADSEQRLNRLTDGQWNPRDSLILESNVGPFNSEIQGTADIVRDDPEQVEIDATMQSPGYVLLADRWDPGWKATVNGQPTTILRADHAFRAIAVPAGVSRIIYRYRPATFISGCYLAGGSALILVLMLSPLHKAAVQGAPGRVRHHWRRLYDPRGPTPARLEG